MIGVVELVNVRKLIKEDSEFTLCDYVPGAYAWETIEVCFVRPDKILGKLKLFDVDDELIHGLAEDD